MVAIEDTGHAKIEDIAHLVSGERGRVVLETGDVDYGVWSAGLCQGLIRDIPTCRELVTRIVSQAEAIIRVRWESMFGEAASE